MVSHDNEAGAAKLIKHTGHDMMIAAKHVTKQLNERDYWLVFGSLCLSKIDRQDVDYNVVSEFREAAINYEKQNYFEAGQNLALIAYDACVSIVPRDQ